VSYKITKRARKRKERERERAKAPFGSEFARHHLKNGTRSGGKPHGTCEDDTGTMKQRYEYSTKRKAYQSKKNSESLDSAEHVPVALSDPTCILFQLQSKATSENPEYSARNSFRQCYCYSRQS